MIFDEKDKEVRILLSILFIVIAAGGVLEARSLVPRGERPAREFERGFPEKGNRTLRISEISVHPKVFNPSRGEKVTIGFKVSRPSKVRVRVLDSETNLVRDLSGGVWQEVHKIIWDGRDLMGGVVPDEAYTFTIEAMDRLRGSAFYDPFGRFDGEETLALKVTYDERRGVVSYHLSRDSRVLIRVGIPKGPLLKTILPWQPRQAGYHEEPWDGKDESGTLYLSQMRGYKLSGEAIPLVENSIITVGHRTVDLDSNKIARGIGRPERKDSVPLGGGPWAARLVPQSLVPKGPIPRFRIDLPEHTLQTETGHFKVKGKVPIRVTLDEGVLKQVTEERYEIILYVDFEFVSEVEEGYSPSTLLWDAKQVGSGEHILTVNVRTLNGQVSSASLRVWAD